MAVAVLDDTRNWKSETNLTFYAIYTSKLTKLCTYTSELRTILFCFEILTMSLFNSSFTSNPIEYLPMNSLDCEMRNHLWNISRKILYFQMHQQQNKETKWNIARNVLWTIDLNSFMRARESYSLAWDNIWCGVAAVPVPYPIAGVITPSWGL